MKKIILIATVVAAVLMSTSCTKVASAWYQYAGFENLKCVDSEEGKLAATAFITELNNVKNSFAGTSFSDSDLISAISAVVTKYDNDMIGGTFSLQKASEEEGPFYDLKTWTMTFDPKYTKADLVQAEE